MSHPDKGNAPEVNLPKARTENKFTKELDALQFEKKNKNLPRIPAEFTVQRRPLNHAPLASPFAGASAQKVVYVSKHTPIMSAVKRVKKLLSQVEKRAMQGVDLTSGGSHGMKKLAEASDKLEKDGEQIFVKASGRAMEQALRVADWFRNKEDDIACKVEVRTGSVQAVDDLVEVDSERADDGRRERKGEDEDLQSSDLAESSIANPTMDTSLDITTKVSVVDGENSLSASTGQDRSAKKSKTRRGKRKRATYDKDDMPEARIRWVKTVEVAISLKG